MTSSTDQNPHPDVMVISDLAEGTLPPGRAAEVGAHVESCTDCTEVLASLREIRDLLGDMPDPGPMPADVAARIDAALVAETSTDPALPHVPRETSLPASFPVSVPTQSGSRTVDVPRGTSTPAGRPPAPTGSGRSRLRRRGLLIGAAYAAAVLALGGVVYQLASDNGPSSMNADSSAERKAGAQDHGSSSTVANEVARLLSGPGGRTGSGGVTSPLLSDNADARVAAPNGTVITVPACVLHATQRTQKPLAADREPFQGTDSYLVVLPDPADTARVDAFVVTADCTPDTPGRVLFQNSYPRS